MGSGVWTDFENKKKEKKEQYLAERAELREEIPAEEYDHQCVLDLGSGNTANALQNKAIKKDLSTEIINLKEIIIKHIDLGKLTSRSRLYIIGHCGPGSSYIESDKDKLGNATKVTAEQFAQMLQDKLKTSSSSKQRIKISLVACNAAVGKGQKKSFAYQLSQALANKGIDAEVIARTGAMNRWNNNTNKDYQKLVDNKYHVSGSKESFTTDPKTGVMTIKSAIYSNEGCK